jgi:octaprenyl-diphosphate synthase
MTIKTTAASNPLEANAGDNRVNTPASPNNSLASLTALVANDLDAVNNLILERLSTDTPLIADVARHLLLAGGKRLRPMLTLLAARLCDYSGPHHIPLAATVEFIHAATLLHDDVVDGSELRRGKKAAHALWGNSASVLVGDYLFTQSFQLMLVAESLEVLRVLSNAAAVIAKGEVMQLDASHHLEITRDDYLRVIHAKTASLFAAAAEVGGIVAKAASKEVLALMRYGEALGMAFQLIDDVLDYTGGGQGFGKELGHDFAEGKMTLPLILAIQADPSHKEFWQRTIESQQQAEGDFAQAVQRITAVDGFTATRLLAERYINQAREALADLPANHYRDALADLCDFCLQRDF